MAIEAARAASDIKANDVLILDMRKIFYLTDYFVICSGNSDRQVARIQREIEERLQAGGRKPFRREGERYKRWIVLDYVDIVVHIFLQEEREYYDIERLWRDAPRVEWEEEPKRAGARA
jgi:ribosome-associated protein